MTDTFPKSRVGLLIVAHLVFGLAMAIPAFVFRGRDWSMWVQVWFAGLACSEILLLGIWAGFTTTAWWLRLLGLVGGCTWLLFLGLSAEPRLANAPMILVLGLPPVLVVAGVCLGFRWFFVRLERRISWKPRSASEELQFTLKSIFGLMVIVCILLALGRLVRWLDDGASGEVTRVCVFVLIALLSTFMLVWASLGQGRPTIRIPLAFAGSLAAGFIVPYYTSGDELRYVAWPALMLVIAAYVSGSLLVIRSCGFRLVSIWKDAAAP